MSDHPWMLFLGWVAVCALVFARPLASLASYALHNDNASHIVIVPFITAWLLFMDREALPRHSSLDLRAAALFATPAGLLVMYSEWLLNAHPDTALTVVIFSLVLFIAAGFIGIWGRQATRRAWFALAFLGFAIPLPTVVLNWLIYELQLGSAGVAGWIFDLSGIAMLREGFVIHLADWNIEVAKECSGIRSSMALLILAVLVAHFSFRPFWKKVLFVAAGLGMMVVKNGVRISTLTILAKYVDPDFLFGKLHHEGGVVFFLIGLALLVPVYWLLRRGEHESVRVTALHREALV